MDRESCNVAIQVERIHLFPVLETACINFDRLLYERASRGSGSLTIITTRYLITSTKLVVVIHHEHQEGYGALAVMPVA